MTLAICIRCGTEKVGAFTPCPGCGFEPEEAEDRAKGLALSDHNLPESDLRGVAESIRAGTEPTFDPNKIKAIADELRRKPQAQKLSPGCMIALWTPIFVLLVLLVLLAIVIGLVVYFRMHTP